MAESPRRALIIALIGWGEPDSRRVDGHLPERQDPSDRVQEGADQAARVPRPEPRASVCGCTAQGLGAAGGRDSLWRDGRDEGEPTKPTCWVLPTNCWQLTADLVVVQAHVNETHAGLASWAKPQGVSGGLIWAPAGPKVVPVPKGVTLCISPWNFPISLALGPVLASIAAGNTVILKPAEQTPNLSNLLLDLFPKYLDQSCYRVVVGAVDEVTHLLKLPLDHVFFTGAGKVGKIVAHAAIDQDCPSAILPYSILAALPVYRPVLTNLSS